MSRERILVLDRVHVPDGGAWHGLRTDGVEALLEAVARHGRFDARDDAEVDPQRKQIIPYLVLRDGDATFLMRRTRAGADARLHDHYSIGIGGHIEPGDGSPLGGLEREWNEEIEADFMPAFSAVGLLNDDTTAVGAVHLGLVYTADAAGRRVAIREHDKLAGSFAGPDEVRAVIDRMESWSRLVWKGLEPSAVP